MSATIFNMVNINRYNPQKQSFLVPLVIFKSVKWSHDQKIWKPAALDQLRKQTKQNLAMLLQSNQKYSGPWESKRRKNNGQVSPSICTTKVSLK